MGKIIKDTIHANGIDIGIYTQDFENEFISLTDIARYKRVDLTAVTQNWMIAKRIFPCTRRICPEPLRIRAKCDMLVEVLLYKKQ